MVQLSTPYTDFEPKIPNPQNFQCSTIGYLSNSWASRFVLFAAPPKFGANIHDTLTLELGVSRVLELPFSANPMPNVRWTYNNGSLPDTERFKSHTTSGVTSLTMVKVVIKDGGYYKVTLENENGQASFTVKLTVIGMLSLLHKFSYVSAGSQRILLLSVSDTLAISKL